MPEKDLYYVAVKVFLEDRGRLFIFRDGLGDWDIPGGRIQKSEFSVSLERILERKMREELGPSVRYELGKVTVLMRHQRKERGSRARIFAIGYRARLKGGRIRLASHHTKSMWVPIASFKPDSYFTGGWLRGVKEYLKIRRTGA